MIDLGNYTFLPWLRRGIANQVTATDGDTGVRTRASTRVHLVVTGDALAGGTRTEDVERDVELYGPGDVVGVDPRAIVRTEPRDWITNFEPNHLAFVEFYDEDFPWRYTPAAPDAARRRLRPWLSLVVLAEEEFTEAGQVPGRPLPTVAVGDLALFPPADELWAWAHVHVNRSLAGAPGEVVSDDMAAVLPRLDAALAGNADLGCSRLLCPRRLEPDRAYHAFLVPTFETGRLAGLGLDPAGAPHATHSGWAPYPAGTRAESDRFPYYHRWYFRTGTVGDFEYLVRLLQPRPVDARVGRRDMDVQDPGANLPGITDPSLGGVLRLGGALQVPELSLSEEEKDEAAAFENWDQPYPHPFQRGLAALVNLADDYADQPATDANAASGLGAAVEDDPDPLLTPPLYGRWHALASRLLTARDGSPLDPDDDWVHELNLDPRFRVPAGFGTGVVQRNQEDYMAAAWEQVGEILEANRRIRLAQVAREAGGVWFGAHLAPLLAANPDRAFLLSAPVHGRVVAGGATVAHRAATGAVTAATTSAALRRAVRPGARLVRALPFDERHTPDNVVTRIDRGEVAAAPPKAAPPAVVTVDEVADATVAGVEPEDLPGWLRWLLVRVPRRWLVIAFVVVLILLLALGPIGWVLAVPLAAAGLLLWRRVRRYYATLDAAADLREENQTPDFVDRLPTSGDFVLTEPGASGHPTPGGADGPEAVRFKEGLRDLAVTLEVATAAGREEPRGPIDVAATARATVAALDPEVTVRRRVLGGLHVPPRLRPLVEQFREAMAYPVIDLPMYRPLVDLNPELFLPNINLLEQNSITLLETNQRFVEAYLAGLNHEFARELLWREYPTDQRGSSFRQFWDVRAYLGAPGEDPEMARERLRDIPPLHRWSRASALGDHDHRDEGGIPQAEVVLAVRGELLKKYPTAVVYAHRAEWPRLPDGSIDLTRERLLTPLTTAEEPNPPRTKVKTPLYEAKVDPDIYFFGFDLTPQEARGGTGELPTDEAGWFFVIKERPGEPRFGFDVDRTGDLNVWNDLAWADVLTAPTDRHVGMGAAAPAHVLVEPTDPSVQEKVVQWQDDRALSWAPATMNASDVAYIAYQAPVLVAVHAAEMLRTGGAA
jgi:hypothetical protein